jgi:hypothetical protein
MLENFHKHRLAFETAVTLIDGRAIDIFVDRPAQNPDALTRSLLEAEVRSVRQSAYGADLEPGIRFTYWSFGILGGTTKIYLYSPTKAPTPLVGDLDAFHAARPAEKRWVAYRAIAGDWYLGLEHD